ncbi:MAG TPA: hypothetical protein VGQ93_10890 [Lysobacter sp.]|jgi:hypothetical protein|nr:hypothetical protein [Lysobacter sp.]
MKQHAAGMIAVLTLTACATPPVKVQVPDPSRSGEVGIEDLTATVAATARMQLADNEHFLPALPEPDNLAPVYPADLLAQRLPPQTVCLRVSVSEAGVVTSSASLQQPPDCDAVDAAPQFLAAAQAAVAGWRFDPALRCVFDRGNKPAYLTCDGAREIPQPVSLTYRFVFEQQDGRGSVRMQ